MWPKTADWSSPPSPCPDFGLAERPFTLTLPGREAFELYSSAPSVQAPVIRIVDSTVTAADEITLSATNAASTSPVTAT